jgi:nitrogen fixation protein NifQ
MDAIVRTPLVREVACRRLLAARRGHANDRYFARILSSQWSGIGALPAELGLDTQSFQRLLVRHFPGVEPPYGFPSGEWQAARRAEQQELRLLLLSYRAYADASEPWMASIVAAACMGNDHLWQDLGLWSRKDLTELLQHNFPGLAHKNDRDMKWKKFLYKELCTKEGIVTCKAPSCAVCVDYGDCFGAE